MSKQRQYISASARVTATLILLSLASATIAHIAIRVPGRAERESQRRLSLGDNLAFGCAPLMGSEDQRRLQALLASFGDRHAEILAAEVFSDHGERLAYWSSPLSADHENSKVIPDIVLLSFPIVVDGASRGLLQLRFASTGWLRSLFSEPAFLAAAITFALNALFFRWHVGRVLNLFDPLSEVPQHVSSTINSFSEGVTILDNDGRIILANDAFASYFQADRSDFIGCPIDQYAWKPETPAGTMPWKSTFMGDSDSAQRIVLTTKSHELRRFLVRSAPILDEARVRVGAIVCFDDVTAMEEKRETLRSMLLELQKSRDELTLRNQELQILATRDPLTSCLNRRTFFELFDKQWTVARRNDKPLSCVMVDIDFFKSINDHHGHRTGDEVLRAVAKSLQDTVQPNHIVCRYGGEEFCILMPAVDIHEAEQMSEFIRQAITRIEVRALKITASIGVSATSLSAIDPQALIDQADKCLYVAKRNGRNQVVRWDEVPENIDQLDSRVESASPEDSIPYPAVASLMSALAYRHPDTAAHSTRVAELAVITARGLMSAKDAYVLEIGGLLHDIGKIGVPDSILLKPGPLTADEWELMQIHDRIGVEIIESSFANPQLVDVLRFHHTWFGGHPRTPRQPTGRDLPLSARIVAIADAYDAIVSDRVYRKGRSQQEAFAELRRCAGTQFDPEIVERFIKVVEEHRSLELPVGSKYSALQIGLQIERLSRAVDEQDRVGIQALAARLEATAAHCQIQEISNLASELRRAAASGDDVHEMIEMTHQLIDLCRSTQRAYVDIDLWDAAETHREFMAFR
jgi:diguanylate cyclase (GGDEF)-like protein/putative nucleotidyltransferase with HDIG domain